METSKMKITLLINMEKTSIQTQIKPSPQKRNYDLHGIQYAF